MGHEWTKEDARKIHQALEVWGVCRGAIWEQYYICFADRPADLVFKALRQLARRKKLRPAPAEIAREIARIRGDRPARCRFCRGREAVKVDIFRAAAPELRNLWVPPGSVYEIPKAPGEYLVRPEATSGLAGRRTTVLLFCGRCKYRVGVMSLDDWLRKYEGFFEAASAADQEVIDERRRLLRGTAGSEARGVEGVGEEVSRVPLA